MVTSLDRLHYTTSLLCLEQWPVHCGEPDRADCIPTWMHQSTATRNMTLACNYYCAWANGCRTSSGLAWAQRRLDTIRPEEIMLKYLNYILLLDSSIIWNLCSSFCQIMLEISDTTQNSQCPFYSPEVWFPVDLQKKHDGVGVAEQEVEEVSLSTDDWVSTVFELLEPVAIMAYQMTAHARVQKFFGWWRNYSWKYCQIQKLFLEYSQLRAAPKNSQIMPGIISSPLDTIYVHVILRARLIAFQTTFCAC